MEENMKRILVVDDEQDLCEILKFNLETEGYEVETANSAEEALEMDIASFDLLLLDVMMGGMSGFQLAKQLKDNPMTANVRLSSLQPEIRKTIRLLDSISVPMIISRNLSLSER